MSRNQLTNAADAAGDRFASTTESGVLRVPGESPTTYEWQQYVEKLELDLERKGLGHVLRGTNGPEHDKVPSHSLLAQLSQHTQTHAALSTVHQRLARV